MPTEQTTPTAPLVDNQYGGVPSYLVNVEKTAQTAEDKGSRAPSADLRWTYADAMTQGHTLGPDDFSQAYHAAGPREPSPNMADHLPTQQDTIDAALSALNQNSLPVTPEAVEQAHSNLLYHWAETGEHPSQAILNPQTRDMVTRQPTSSPPIQALQTTIQHLETGGLSDADAAVSPTGAIGRNQILPSTAREYGFDPSRLHEADYNNTVRDAILQDLTRRYHGDAQAVLVAYNAGPAVADKWLANDRETATLPAETQKYLQRGGQSLGFTVPAPNTVPPTWGAPVEEPGDQIAAQGAEKVADWVGDALNKVAETTGLGTSRGLLGFGDLLQSAGIPTINEQLADVQAHVKEMQAAKDEEGKPKYTKADVLAYSAEQNPIANAFGVGNIAEAGTAAMRYLFPSLGNAANDEAREAVQASIVKETGIARRWQAMAGAMLEESRKLTAKGLQATQDYLDTKPGIAAPLWPAPDNINLIDHIENVSPYAGGSRLASNSPLRPVADSIRHIYQMFRDRIEQSGYDTSGFIEDYFPHFWEQPGKAPGVITGRTGSNRNLQSRHIPTFMEGIQQGLTPKYLDPIEATLRYITAMSNFLAHHDVLEEGERMGHVQFVQAGHQPTGWVTLKGKSSTRVNMGGPDLRAYAPQGWAQSFNRWVSTGLIQGEKSANVVRAVTQAANMTTAMRLGVSGYHAWNIAVHSISSHLAAAVGNIAHGELTEALKNAGLGVSMVGAPIRDIARGRALQHAYLTEQGPPLDNALMELYSRAGGRVVGRGLEYGYEQANNLWDAFKRGSLGFELKQEFTRGLFGEPEENLIQSSVKAPGRIVGAFAHEVVRAMSAFTAPLFDKVIPAIKTAAWANEMEAWLRQNPSAAAKDVMSQARLFQRVVDDRFGEMVQDNLFWPRSLKQMLNMATVSVGYEYGTLRTFIGGAHDLLSGDVLSPRARYLLVYPMVVGMVSGIYQYLKTGISGPTQATPIRDTAAPRTGGVTPYGQPERALLPGDQKDVEQVYNLFNSAPNYTMWPSALMGYAENKANPLLGDIIKPTITGSYWNGDPIYSQVPDPVTGHPVPGWEQYADHVMKSYGLPISISNIQQTKPGSNIGNLERFLGVRPAPEWLQDPEHTQAAQRRATQFEIRREERERARGIEP